MVCGLEDGEGGLEGTGVAFHEEVVVNVGMKTDFLGDSRVVEKAETGPWISSRGKVAIIIVFAPMR
jgi:hypothetical protein